MSTPEKEILVCFLSGRVEMLIPKKRGEGFLKVPLGHHHNGLSKVAMTLSYDVFGLDGALEIVLPRSQAYIMPKDQTVFLKTNVEPLTNYLGFPYRVVSSGEFWTKHPVAPKEI